MSDATIENDARARQFNSFTGLRYKNGSPTDIDLFLEFDGNIYIIAELKLKGTPMKDGQRIAYESLIKRLGKNAICILAEHEVHNPDEDVIAANARVLKYYWQGQWKPPEHPIMLKEAIDKFLVMINKSEYIHKTLISEGAEHGEV